MNPAFAAGAVITAIVIIAALIALFEEYRATRPRTDSYCPANHPARQARIRHVGGQQYACECPTCQDRAVITATNPTTAADRYAEHACTT